MAINRPAGKPRKNEEFFPKIAEIIHHLYRKNQRFIRHDEILKGLQSTDAGARKRVGEYTQGFYEVCWFSADETKYRNGDSSVLKWGPLFDQFERKKIQGRAAY